MKIRIVKPEVNAIANHWGYEYAVSDTVEVDIDEIVIDWFADSTDLDGKFRPCYKSFGIFLQEKLNVTSA